MSRQPVGETRRAAGKSPVRRATASQILNLLNHDPERVFEALKTSPAEANLSLPTDGKGARIRASVRAAARASIPKTITIGVDQQIVKVPVEVVGDFQEFRPLK